MSDSTRCWNASPCLPPGLLTRARFPWPALGNLREEPSAGKPHARIRGGESRMAELPDRHRREVLKQVFVSNRRGIVVETVAMPSVQDKYVLVANAFSLISTGTELRAVESAKSGIAAQICRPTELAQKVVRKLRDAGVVGLLKHALRPPETFGAVGYSTSGVVLAIGRGVTDLNPGDRVACGGAEAAHHAEVVSVPRLLAARLPDAVSFRDAAFTTLGPIAMQGGRLAQCN